MSNITQVCEINLNNNNNVEHTSGIQNIIPQTMGKVQQCFSFCFNNEKYKNQENLRMSLKYINGNCSSFNYICFKIKAENKILLRRSTSGLLSTQSLICYTNYRQLLLPDSVKFSCGIKLYTPT